MTESQEKQVTKRRVTMRSSSLLADGSAAVQEAVDYVRPDFLDEYVRAAQQRWQYVEVSEEPDAGPSGYDGPTFVPAEINHPLAGQFFPAEGDHPLAGMSLEQIREYNQNQENS